MRGKSLALAGLGVAGLLTLLARHTATRADAALARASASALAAAMVAPRAVWDGRTLEARHAAALTEVIARSQAGPDRTRASIERFARQPTPPGDPAPWLVPLTARRFEIAAGAAREKGEQGDWRALLLAGVLESGRGRQREAEQLLVRAYELAQAGDVLDHPDAAGLHTALGTMNLLRGHADAAEPLLRRAKTILDRAPDADPRDHLHVLTFLARAIFAQGFPEEAEPLAARALTLAEQHERTTGEPFPSRAILEENLRRLRSR